jgi:hypothetical protein
MNEKAFEDKVKKDIHTVLEDGRTGLGKLDQSTRKMKQQLTTWAEDESANLSQKYHGY